MAKIEYEVALRVEDMGKVIDTVLELPIGITFVVLVGPLRVKCDSQEEAEKYLELLKQEEIKSRTKGKESGKGTKS